jgi:hypothetical protein
VAHVTNSDDRHAPLVTWSGWDARGGAAVAADAPTRFAALPAETAETRYELLAIAARGFRPPRFLRSAAAGPDHETEGGIDAEPAFREFKQTWSLEYRRLAETAPPLTAPFAIYLLGVNPPVGATQSELEVFNDFYTNVHLPEVAERRRALRAERYELVREIQLPYQGAPQFLAVYEVDEESAAHRRHAGPPYAAGPEVWQRHSTPWRLWYRRLASEADAPPG